VDESWFLWVMSQPRRTISLSAARLLARQLRELAMDQHEEAVSQVGISRACPFDLHSLVPAPASILQLPEDDPRAKAWMWGHWSTTWPLRYVERRPLSEKEVAALPEGHMTFRVAFWSADWTPWQALKVIVRRWPGLTMQIKVNH
jgi:hypothetical protein